MLENIYLRYFIPPIFFLISLGVGVSTGTHCNKLQEFLKRIVLTESLASATVAVITGVTLVVALGYLIGVVGATLLRLLGLFPCLPRGMSTYWRKDAKANLKNLYKFQNNEINKQEAELAEQCFISEFFSPHLYAWLRGRWEYCFTNYNGALAVLLLFILAYFLKIPCWWWVINFLFLLMFGFNAWQSYWEVTEMNHFVLSNYDRMGSREHKSLRI